MAKRVLLMFFLLLLPCFDCWAVTTDISTMTRQQCVLVLNHYSKSKIFTRKERKSFKAFSADEKPKLDPELFYLLRKWQIALGPEYEPDFVRILQMKGIYRAYIGTLYRSNDFQQSVPIANSLVGRSLNSSPRFAGRARLTKAEKAKLKRRRSRLRTIAWVLMAISMVENRDRIAKFANREISPYPTLTRKVDALNDTPWMKRFSLYDKMERFDQKYVGPQFDQGAREAASYWNEKIKPYFAQLK